MNALVQIKEIELRGVKNNVIMEFIEKEIGKLQEVKKKELPPCNNLQSYKRSMREKSVRIRKSTQTKNHNSQSAKNLIDYGHLVKENKECQGKFSYLVLPNRIMNGKDE